MFSSTEASVMEESATNWGNKLLELSATTLESTSTARGCAGEPDDVFEAVSFVVRSPGRRADDC